MISASSVKSEQELASPLSEGGKCVKKVGGIRFKIWTKDYVGDDSPHVRAASPHEGLSCGLLYLTRPIS